MNKPSEARVIGTILTVLFGSLPATYIAMLPVIAIFMGIATMSSSDSFDEFSAALLLVLWGFAGLIGTVALWVVAFARRSFWTVAGLVLGLIAIFPATILAFMQFDVSSALLSTPTWQSIGGLSFVTVPAVAFGWLYYFAVTRPRI